MNTLTVSAKNLLGAPKLKTRDFSLSAAAQARFSRFSTPIHDNVNRLSRSISLKPLKSGELKSSSSSFSRTAMTDAQNEAMYEQKTVHVKFQLQRECLSDERIFLIGDGINYIWELENAIPMECSKDHIWTAELDLPVEKYFKFRFIVEAKAGDKLWQPEPDRVIKPWETRNTLVVLEDWKNAALQKISEEPSEHLNDAEIRKVSEEPSKDLKDGPDKHMDVVENIPHMGATRVSNNQVVALADDTIGSAGIVSTEKKVGETVLVPGLTHMTEEVFSATPQTKKVYEASFGNDEAEDPDMPEKNQAHEKQEETTQNRANEAREENTTGSV